MMIHATRRAKIITIGNSKGGVGKTTTSSIIAWLLAKKYNVLAVDMDVQADMSKFLLNIKREDLTRFDDAGVYKAIQTGDAAPYVITSPLPDRTLDVLPASEHLALYDASSFEDYQKLSKALETIRDKYDFILIDTPPTISSFVISSILASDFVIGMVQTHRFAMDQIESYMEKVKDIRKYKPTIKYAGMVVAMFERTKNNQKFLDAIRDVYGKLVFNTTILKRSRLADMTIDGLSDKRAADKKALEQYIQLAKEIEHVTN